VKDAAPRRPALPGLGDPRWLQLASQTGFVLYALRSEAFLRSPAQYLAGFAGCVGVDLLVLRLIRRTNLAPVSGLISSMGVLLLCDSPRVWPYFLVGALAIASKHLLRVGERHIFNPTNFALVFAVLFLPQFVTIDASRWGGGFWIMAAVAGLGVLTTWRAKRLDMAACYALGFAGSAWALEALAGKSPAYLIGSMTGAEFQLFAFFMITDPRTTPDSPWARRAFGAVIGVLDTILRLCGLRNAPYYSLFVMTALLPALRLAPPFSFRRPSGGRGASPARTA
jgi:Na+-transporting NADH:ubiquinone oxidoreductase subunit NqrB